ncbi:MAG TPA: VIT domain-containing protein [Thermoguttaceae bacterium]|nr:VIT domain-containing protein [Thermoguttaceae bacterium]
MNRLTSLLTALVLLVLPALAWGQGLLVVVDPNQQVRLPRPIIIWPPHPPHPPRPIPRPVPPPTTYKIQELDVNARLIDQVAQVRVSQSFVNTGSRQLEVCFIFPLPYEGAVDQMTLLVDGKEYPAKLMEADDARRMYEEIVRKNKDPALLEWMGTGLFKTSVFPVPPGAKRTVSLRYSQLLRKQEGLTDFLFPLSTAKYTSHAVEKVHVRATIESEEEIKNVYSPTHSVKIKRPDDRHATVEYTSENEVPTADFRLFYDVGKGKVSTRVLSYRPERQQDGYFLLLASPKIKAPDQKPPKKTVVFVVDRSGSMSGTKIEQARGAAKFVLQNLREGDLFNIVAYDSEVESFRPELQRFNDDTRKAALGFIEGVYAGGSTNIDGALRVALKQLQDSSRPSYVLFLTDGLPTAGVTNEMQIVENAREANDVRARVFTFGVGYDVNSRLLDKLVRTNHGQSEYVRPDEDVEDRVSRLYRRIESPVMTDVDIELVFDERKTEEGKPINRVYPKGAIDLFAGEQLVVVGRYKKSGTAKVVIHGSVGGQEQKLDFPAKLAKKSGDETFAFIEKLWAVRRVGEILDEIDLKGKNQELVKELIDLATRHGILTPYTSFLADENTNVRDLASNTRRAGDRLSALEQEVSGASGFYQRAFKGSMQRASRVAASPAAPAAGSGGMMGGRAMPGASFGYGAGAAMPAEAEWLGRVARRAERMSAADLGALAESAGEMEDAVQTVRNIGNRAFYRRADRWVDSTVTGEQEKAAVRVKQFSDDYFALTRRFGRDLTQYLVFDEPVLVNLESQAYMIEP